MVFIDVVQIQFYMIISHYKETKSRTLCSADLINHICSANLSCSLFFVSSRDLSLVLVLLQVGILRVFPVIHLDWKILLYNKCW